jgi:hypothetical protein
MGGSFRPDRHSHLLERASGATPASPARVSTWLRRAALRGLSRTARRIAVSLLESYGDWDGAAVETLRQYALSCERLEALQASTETDVRTLHRETRINLQLLKALDLEPRGPR